MALTSSVRYYGTSPAKRWTIRGQRTPAILRAAMGANLKLVKTERGKLIQSTIYRRGLQLEGRFSYTLQNSERTFVRGNSMGIANNARSKGGYRYAQKRNDMTGYSKTYRMYKNSNFAGKSLVNTKNQRGRNIRAAMRAINEAGDE